MDLLTQPSLISFVFPPHTHSVLKSIVFVGSIFGMCVMGYVGDVMGRNKGERGIDNLAYVHLVLKCVCMYVRMFTFLKITSMQNSILEKKKRSK
jgi:sugar phosphate permease